MLFRSSLVTEGVYGANRFKYVDELKRLGAHIQVDGKVAVVEGVQQLVGAPIQVICITTASRNTALFTPCSAACGPKESVLPTLPLVRVRNLEWSWLESSFMATCKEGAIILAIWYVMAPIKLSALPSIPGW